MNTRGRFRIVDANSAGGGVNSRGGTIPPLTDALVMATLRDGGRTHQLAERLGMCNRRPEILRRLRKLETAGRVMRNPQHTAVNDIYWEPTS